MKFKKIIFVLIIFLLGLQNFAYAKYVYNFDEEIIKLSRDNKDLNCDIEYSTQEWTNKSVVITIKSNKELQPVNGFKISKNKKSLKKEVYENGEEKVFVRDVFGNEEIVEYKVSNIDREGPKSLVLEENKEIEKMTNVDFEDESGVKEIFIDRYNDKLVVEQENNYWDASYFFGIDKTSKTITIHITKHPKYTRKYKIFLNNNYYTVTKDIDFTITNLKPGKNYKIKVEALDEDGNVIDETELTSKTSYYEKIFSSKENGIFKARLNKLDKCVSKIEYAVWNYNDNENIKWFDSEIKNNTAEIELKKQNNEYYPFYGIHVYFYDEDGNVLDVVEFSIDFETNYEMEDVEESEKNEFCKPGKYLIILRDFADNETVYDINVK